MATDLPAPNSLDPPDSGAELTGLAGVRLLASGTVLGAYRIDSLVGAGGMGQVFRARDLKLDRTVAVKVLFTHASDPGHRDRFQREARMASSLNHPHILTVHDAGQID